MTDRGSTEHLATVARGGALNLAGAFASGLLSFVLVVVVTRGLGPRSAGAFFVAIALFSLVSKTLELGADTGLVRTVSRLRALGRVSDIRRSLEVAIGPVIGVGLVATAAIWMEATDLARLLARGSPPHEVAPLLRALAPFVPVASVYTVTLAATRGFGTMVPSVIVDRTVKPALQPLLVGLVVGAGWGATTVVLAWAAPIAAAWVAASLWLLALVRRAEAEGAHDPAQMRPRRRLAASFWRFTAPRGLAGFFQVAIVWVDTLLIGALRSAREAGIYAAATRYTLISTFALTAIIQVIGPKISELIARKDRTSAGAVYQVSTAWLVLMTWPVNFTIVAFAPVLVSVFGRGFEAGQTPLFILGFAMFVATLAGPVDVVLLMAGKSSWNLFNTLVSLILNVTLNLLLIPRWGINGAAIAWAASILANNALPLAQTWRLLRLHPFGRGSLRAVIITSCVFGLIASLVRLLLGGSLRTFLLYAVVSCTLYLILLVRSREVLELDVVKNALLRRGARPR
jgi:O-antigen/teichoic acid export membrane protein